MIRRAFTMRLKPDSLSEYKYHHDNIWPELVAEIERAGIASITTFQNGLDLFLISEIVDEGAWDKLWNSETHKRWAEVMQPLMHLRDDGIVDAGDLTEIFHLKIDSRQPASAADAHANGLAGNEHGNGLAARPATRGHRKVASKPPGVAHKKAHPKKTTVKPAKRTPAHAKVAVIAKGKVKKAKKLKGKAAPKKGKRAAKKKARSKR